MKSMQKSGVILSERSESKNLVAIEDCENV